ncbi:Nucleoporin SEH1 [Sparganum proliferum]
MEAGPLLFGGSLLASAGDDGTVRLWRSNFLNGWHPVSVVTPGGSAAPESGLPIPPPLFAAAAALGGEQSQRDPSLLGVSRGIPLDGSSSVKPVSSETSVSTIGSGIQSGRFIVSPPSPSLVLLELKQYRCLGA